MAHFEKVRRVALSGGITLSLALCMTSAFAFTPEPIPQPSAQTNAQDGKKTTDEAAKLADPLNASKSKGTEINIPGIGSLGSLPKLDFGLELLYSQQSNNPAGPPSTTGVPLDPRAPENNMEIKGSLTHKF